MLKTVGITLGLLVTLALSAVMAGRLMFQRHVGREIDQMFEECRQVNPVVLKLSDIAGLPAPVQRWIRYSGVLDKERVFSVRLKQKGLFRLAADQAWMPFKAEQYYTTGQPAFIWHAKFNMKPFLTIQGRDKYTRGNGHMWFKVLSIITVADATGHEVNQGALLRYLNEMMWFPTAALNDYIEWEPIDDGSAKATMSYGGVTASALFYFDENGALTNMVAERYREINGDFKLDTWSTPIQAYGEFGGIKVPVKGTGVWQLETGDFAYIDLEVTDLEYNTPSKY